MLFAGKPPFSLCLIGSRSMVFSLPPHSQQWQIIESNDQCKLDMAYTGVVAFDGLSKMCPIASPLLAVLLLVAHRVFAFWVGNCHKLELAPIRYVLPNQHQAIVCQLVAHRFTTSAV